MQIRALSVADCFVVTPAQHADDRGVFLEWFREDLLEPATGHRFALAQANTSVSSRGVLRGVHYADVPPGQAKYVTCVAGAVLDVVVDLRVDSPTFGQTDSVRLDDVDRRAVYLAEGLGHAFVALSDTATVTYLCSTTYHPQREHAVNPLDPALGLPLPDGLEPRLSPRDADAPSLQEARLAGLLPSYPECQRWYQRRNPLS